MTRPARAARTSRYLLPDETAEIETRRHWMILARPVLISLAIIAVAMFVLSSDPYSDSMINVVAAALLGVAGYLGYQILEWRLDHFVVTDRRVLLVSGVLTKKTAVMPLLKVTDLTYEQSPLARILGYGTFVFESAGQDQALSRVDYLPGGPRQLYIQISGLLFATYGGPSPPTPDPRPPLRRQSTVDVRAGAPVEAEGMRTHPTTPIPPVDDPYAPGREGDD